MKELSVTQMEHIEGGTRAGCFMLGLFGSLAIATGGLGFLVYGPAALGAGIDCLANG